MAPGHTAPTLGAGIRSRLATSSIHIPHPGLPEWPTLNGSPSGAHSEEPRGHLPSLCARWIPAQYLGAGCQADWHCSCNGAALVAGRGAGRNFSEIQ